MATVQKASSPAHTASSQLVPAAPERLAKKRKRLAKAFARPLDKTLRDIEQGHVRFSMLADEYAQLAELKQRLAAQGVGVKKGELLRAGLRLLATLDDAQLLAARAKLPVIV